MKPLNKIILLIACIPIIARAQMTEYACTITGGTASSGYVKTAMSTDGFVASTGSVTMYLRASSSDVTVVAEPALPTANDTADAITAIRSAVYSTIQYTHGYQYGGQLLATFISKPVLSLNNTQMAEN